MRKFSAILIIISLLVSVFDIIDTSDIMLGNKAAFSSTNDLNQDHTDDLDVYGGFNLKVLVFNLVDTCPDFVYTIENKIFYPQYIQYFHEDFIPTFSEPPIA